VVFSTQGVLNASGRKDDAGFETCGVTKEKSGFPQGVLRT